MNSEKAAIAEFEYQLKVDQILTEWDGKPVMIIDEVLTALAPVQEVCKECKRPLLPAMREMLLSDALLDYCNRAEQWGLGAKEQFQIYDLGERIVKGSMVRCSLAEWDLLKKLVAAAKERYATRIKIQVERLVSAAKQVSIAKVGELAAPVAGEEGGGGND